MSLFKKKVPIKDYYIHKCDQLFSQDRKETWERMREMCDSVTLKDVDKEEYYSHMRAIYLEFFGIAILKSTNHSIAMEAHIAKDEYLESKNYSETRKT